MCLSCGFRFTTYERIQRRNLFVVKKDGRREEFDRDKIYSGIRKACEKRPLPSGTIDKIVDDIEADLFSRGRGEVPSSLIGEIVAERLGYLDPIAYIRFASVYREFDNLDMLKRAVDTLASSQGRARISVSQLPLLPDDETDSAKRRRSGRLKKGAVLDKG